MAKVATGKAALAAKFVKLDKLAHLQPRVKVSTGKRHISSGSKSDSISEAVKGCAKASEVAALASHLGAPDAYILGLAKSAPNFGQFTMCVTNKLRGVVKRVSEATEAGKKVKPADVFEIKDFKALMRGEDGTVAKKPTAAKKKVVKKKVVSKKVTAETAPKKTVSKKKVVKRK